MEYSFKPEEVIVSSWSDKRSSWGLSPPTGVQVVHLKTGIVVTCNVARSQHRNRHIAFLELEWKLKSVDLLPMARSTNAGREPLFI